MTGAEMTSLLRTYVSGHLHGSPRTSNCQCGSSQKELCLNHLEIYFTEYFMLKKSLCRYDPIPSLTTTGALLRCRFQGVTREGRADSRIPTGSLPGCFPVVRYEAEDWSGDLRFLTE
jgi:hypothetical protein